MPIPSLNPPEDWRNQKQHQAKREYHQPAHFAPPTSPGNNHNRIPSAWKRHATRIGRKFFRVGLAVGFLAFIIGALWGGILFLRLSQSIPNPNTLIDREIAQSTKIFDRTGETVLYEIHGEEKRTLVPLSEIPASLKNATIAIEDKDFYTHQGFSLWGIFRSLVKNIFTGSKAGGSTLTQQLVKNSVLTVEKTYTRKIKELILAYKVEKSFTKDEILQMYFNEIPYGSNAYGAEAAAQKYFDKHARELTLGESAILAAMVQAPSRYSPYGSSTETLFARQQYILQLMTEQGYINTEEMDAAKNEQIAFKQPSENILAPHFVMLVREQLAQKYGEQVIEQGGLKIYTTLDFDKQKMAEETIAKNESLITNIGANNAALVAMDPKTGQILAMVGSRDFFNDEIDGQVNIATSLRQPGSSIKPLAYAALINEGYTADTVFYDVVTQFNTNKDGEANYEPRNYNDKELGAVTLRQALAGSLNIPAVKALYLAGVKTVTDLAREVGYTTLNDPDRYGLSLVLGGGEIKMIEHTNAFSAFAREGEMRPIAYILKVEDKDGKTLEEWEDKKRLVLNPYTARVINNILSDNQARSYVFGTRNWLFLDSRPTGTAGKTGTTNDYRDAWMIGYSPSLVASVWVGNTDNSKMKPGADGSKIAAPIWNAFMASALAGTPIESFKTPDAQPTEKPVLDGVKTELQIIELDKVSGLLATEFTPPIFTEEKAYYSPRSILHYVNRNDPRGPEPQDPARDSQYVLWEDAIKRWVEREKDNILAKIKEEKIKAGEAPELLNELSISFDSPPTEKDNVHTPENRPTFSVENLSENQTITASLLYINLTNLTAPRGINRAEYYFNGRLSAVNTNYPFNFAQDVAFLSNGQHALTIKACDDIDNCTDKIINFNFSISDDERANIEPSLTLTSPTNGIALNTIDFPYHITTSLNNPFLVNKIIFYGMEKSSGNILNLGEINDISAQNILEWSNDTTTGEITIYAEAYLTNGSVIRSNQTTVVVSK